MSARPGRTDASARRRTASLLLGGLVIGAGLAMLLASASGLGSWNGSAAPTRGDDVASARRVS